MNVMEKSDIDYAIKYLKIVAQGGDYRHRFALNNVICVLEQALEGYVEDEQRPHLYLNVVKAPTLLDASIGDCCTTVCRHYRQGTCSFSLVGKEKCPRIRAYMEAQSIYFFRKL